MDGDGIWVRDVRLTGEERGRRNVRKVYQMYIGGGIENAGLYGESGSKEGQTDGKGEEERAGRYEEKLRRGVGERNRGGMPGRNGGTRRTHAGIGKGKNGRKTGGKKAEGYEDMEKEDRNG